jgi:hypothetical protein
LDAAFAIFYNLKQSEVTSPLDAKAVENAAMDQWSRLPRDDKLRYLKHDPSQLDKYGFPVFSKEKGFELSREGNTNLIDAVNLMWSGLSLDEKLVSFFSLKRQLYSLKLFLSILVLCFEVRSYRTHVEIDGRLSGATRLGLPTRTNSNDFVCI